MTKADKIRWAEDTQLFQRIAGVKASSTEELEYAWDEMRTNKQRRYATCYACSRTRAAGWRLFRVQGNPEWSCYDHLSSKERALVDRRLTAIQRKDPRRRPLSAKEATQ